MCMGGVAAAGGGGDQGEGRTVLPAAVVLGLEEGEFPGAADEREHGHKYLIIWNF